MNTQKLVKSRRKALQLSGLWMVKDILTLSVNTTKEITEEYTDDLTV